MSCYIMKVTRHTVELANGEDANVAVFAHRNEWGMEAVHVTSGAAACDRAAAEGRRGPWVILGFQRDDGKIEVDVGDSAKKIGVVGSFPDDWFDRKDADTSKPDPNAKNKASIVLTRVLRTIRSPLWPVLPSATVPRDVPTSWT